MNSILNLNDAGRQAVNSLTIITKLITRLNLLFLPEDYAEGFIKQYKYLSTFRIFINFETSGWGYTINTFNLSKITIDPRQTYRDGGIIKTYDTHREQNFYNTSRFTNKLIKIYKKITSIDRITIDHDTNVYEYI
jgi:hypothetical protein